MPQRCGQRRPPGTPLAGSGLPERTLGRWYYRYLEHQKVDTPAPQRKPMEALGIDELALKKRHRQFVAVIVDHTNRCVLEVLESRLKADVKACLRRLSERGLLDHLEEVSCDIWEGYAHPEGTRAREVLGPAVKVSVDRFLMMKAFQDQLTKARREIQRELSAEEAKELKGSRTQQAGCPVGDQRRESFIRFAQGVGGVEASLSSAGAASRPT